MKTELVMTPYSTIKEVFDTHDYAWLYIDSVLEYMQEDPLPVEERHPYLSSVLSKYYYECVEFILNETPSNAVGNMLVRHMCMQVPDIVFDSLAHDYLTAIDLTH
jgi:hypothetical protein